MIEQTKQAAGAGAVGFLSNKSVPTMLQADLPCPVGGQAAKPATFQETLEANSKESLAIAGSPQSKQPDSALAVPHPAASVPGAQSGVAIPRSDVSAIAESTSKRVAAPLSVLQQPAGSMPLNEAKGSAVVLASPARGIVEREKKHLETGKSKAEKAKATVVVSGREVELPTAPKLITRAVELSVPPETPVFVQVKINASGTSVLASSPVELDPEAKKGTIPERVSAVSAHVHAASDVNTSLKDIAGELEAAPHTHTEAPLVSTEAKGVSATNALAKDHSLTQVALIAGTVGMHAAPPRAQEVVASGNSTTSPMVPRASAPVHGEQPEMKTLFATSHVLEIGVGDGTHGWLRVRAELGRTGEVTASVVAASIGAAEKLHRELPEMSAYLRSEQVQISSLVVHATAKSAATPEQAMSMGAGNNAESNSREDREHGTHAGKETTATAVPGSRLGPVAKDTALSSALAGAGTMLALNVDGSGGWLNVRV